MRLELTQANAHHPLKVACIPISPPEQNAFYTKKATTVALFERKTGLEPATPTLARSCSTN